jgi:hypothetical protein
MVTKRVVFAEVPIDGKGSIRKYSMLIKTPICKIVVKKLFRRLPPKSFKEVSRIKKEGCIEPFKIEDDSNE